MNLSQTSDSGSMDTVQDRPRPTAAPKMFHSYERMSVPVPAKQLTSIEYPGIVENVDKALQTLGGQKGINKSLASDKKRLELRFRPDDVYCKPAFGTTQKTSSGLLMRVKRRQRKLPETVSSSAEDEDQDTEDDGYEYAVEILGTVNTVIKFEGMCEFQYLPVMQKQGGAYENILERLTLNRFTTQDEYMSRDAPLFLSPVLFTRFDTPQEYGYLQARTFSSKACSNNSEPADRVAVGRKKRQSFTTMVTFNDPSPTQPSKEALALANMYSSTGLVQAVEELFKERPIWPKSALVYHLRHNRSSQRHLKKILPSLAYVFLTGPWRTFWIKMGYDPRKDPAAKMYQGIDFRRRQKGVGEALKIKSKRSTKKTDPLRKAEVTTEINVGLLRDDKDEPEDSKEPKLRDFEFHSHVLPPHRQVCYMLCDIYDSEIQALAKKNDGKEKVCDERNGWCVNKFTDTCRSIMAGHVDKLCPDNAMPTAIAKKLRTKHQKIQAALLSSDEEEEEDEEDNAVE